MYTYVIVKSMATFSIFMNMSKITSKSVNHPRRSVTVYRDLYISRFYNNISCVN